MYNAPFIQIVAVISLIWSNLNKQRLQFSSTGGSIRRVVHRYCVHIPGETSALNHISYECSVWVSDIKCINAIKMGAFALQAPFKVNLKNCHNHLVFVYNRLCGFICVAVSFQSRIESLLSFSTQYFLLSSKPLVVFWLGQNANFALKRLEKASKCGPFYYQKWLRYSNISLLTQGLKSGLSTFY